MNCSQPNQENCCVANSAEVYPHNKKVGWRMETCIEANPFVGATGTGAELLWKVTPVNCCIELCWIGDKIWHLSIKVGLFPPIFNWPILQIFWTIGIVSFILGTRQYLKRFSSALKDISTEQRCVIMPSCVHFNLECFNWYEIYPDSSVFVLASFCSTMSGISRYSKITDYRWHELKKTEKLLKLFIRSKH